MTINEQIETIKSLPCTIGQESELRDKLAENRKLTIKYGIDPTGTHIHLGHTVPMRILRAFQEMGHDLCIIIGDTTARIGDPTGHKEARKPLTTEQVKANSQHYLKQLEKIITLDQTVEITYNSEWLNSLSFDELIDLIKVNTVQQMMARDEFNARYRAGKPIYLHELLYPLMQAYDSVETNADVEIGGQDQLFNMMLGRDIQRIYNKKAQVTITTPILRGLDGERRMGKTNNNYIAVDDNPFDMFCKVMSIPDSIMFEWFKLLTDKQSAVCYKGDGSIISPLETKKVLAHAITEKLHTTAAAATALKQWHQRVSCKEDSETLPEVTIPASEINDGKIWACKLLWLLGLTTSKNEGRRLISQGGVNYGPNKTKADEFIPVENGLVVRVGTRRAAKVKVG